MNSATMCYSIEQLDNGFVVTINGKTNAVTNLEHVILVDLGVQLQRAIDTKCRHLAVEFTVHAGVPQPAE